MFTTSGELDVDVSLMKRSGNGHVGGAVGVDVGAVDVTLGVLVLITVVVDVELGVLVLTAVVVGQMHVPWPSHVPESHVAEQSKPAKTGTLTQAPPTHCAETHWSLWSCKHTSLLSQPHEIVPTNTLNVLLVRLPNTPWSNKPRDWPTGAQ